MAIHTHSDDVFRLDVVESGRRRRWSEAEKLRIVAESASGPQLVSATARRHGLSRSQLFAWRRALLKTGLSATPPSFVPAVVVPDDSVASMTPPSPAVPLRIEIVLRGGRRLIIEGAVDTAVTLELARGLEALR